MKNKRKLKNWMSAWNKMNLRMNFQINYKCKNLFLLNNKKLLFIDKLKIIYIFIMFFL